MTMTMAVLGWVFFALVSGAAAQVRGRNPVAWFGLAILMTPPAAMLFILALPRLTLPPSYFQAFSAPIPLFESNGVHAGVPFRVNADETVDGMTEAGAMIRFRQMEEFKAFAECRVGRVLNRSGIHKRSETN